jgi:hypothetical protein
MRINPTKPVLLKSPLRWEAKLAVTIRVGVVVERSGNTATIHNYNKWTVLKIMNLEIREKFIQIVKDYIKDMWL